MNLGHLAVFHAVARTLSISRAGEELMISQPAVSKQLAQLEKSLKTVLVDRLPRGVRLTAAGEVLAEYAHRIFGLQTEAERAMRELAGVERGRLAIAATPTIGTYWLPPLLVRYRQAYPKLEMRMEVHPTATIARLLMAREIEIGLAESPVADAGLDASVFLMDRMVAISQKGSPLSRKRQVTAKELCRHPFVVREVGSGSQSLVERALAQRGLKFQIAMSLGSTEAIKRAVMEGIGVAIVSRLAVMSELAAGSLAIINVRDLNIERPLYLVQASQRTDSAATA